MYMRNHDCNNGLYFMLGAMMTAVGCMGYCMCKSNGSLEKLSCHNGNGKRRLRKMGKRHLGHKCHHGHRGHGVDEEYQGYQIPEDEFPNEMNSSQQNLHNQQSNNNNSQNPENEQQKEQQVTHQEY